MNSALETLKKSDPRLYKKFMEALQQDLGISAMQHVISFQCPACNTRFEINAGTDPNGPRARKQKDGDSTLELLLELARLKKTTTGNIHVEFNNAFHEKLKGMRAPQIREMKRQWLKQQVERHRKTKAS